MKIIRKTNVLVKTKRELKISRRKVSDEFTVCPKCGEAISADELMNDSADNSLKHLSVEENPASLPAPRSFVSITEKVFRRMTFFFKGRPEK